MTDRRTGRPQTFSPERAALVLAALRVGATYRHAAAAGGISDDTLARWRKRNAGFAADVQRVEAEVLKNALTCINSAAAAGNWHAAAWLLARRYPEDYGTRVTRHEGKDGGPVETKVRLVYEDMTDDTRRDIIRRVLGSDAN